MKKLTLNKNNEKNLILEDLIRMKEWLFELENKNKTFEKFSKEEIRNSYDITCVEEKIKYLKKELE